MSDKSWSLLISLEKVDEHGWPVLMMHEGKHISKAEQR